jgi:hypothetical protein
MDYICWRPPEGVMETPPEFIHAGLLIVGSTLTGDLIVIDTQDADSLTMGFVSHEELWEGEAEPREAYRRWKDDLITFLDRLDSRPNYVLFF